MRLLKLYMLLLLFHQMTLYSESFVKEKCEFVGSVEYLVYKTHHFWNSKGKKLPSFNDFDVQSGILFLKYGVTDADTVVARGAYNCICESMNGKTIGFEDSELGWRHALLGWKGWDFSAQLLAIIPSGRERDSLRYGRFGTEVDLHGQKYFCFNQNPGWFEVLVGYRAYSGFPSDQIRANTRLGYDLCPWFQLSAGAQLEYGVFNGTKSFSGPSILLEPNYRLLKIDYEALIRLTSISYIRLGGFQHVWGRNVGTGGGWYGGLLIDL